MKNMNIPFSPPDITELEINQVTEILKSGWITTGPKTKKFEQLISMYCGTNKTVCLNSATAAMELTLRLFGIGPGDEVIVPAYTYTASCSVICHVGAVPVMIDTGDNSFEMDYDKLASLITSKTKAIIPVDIAGILCDYERIFKVVNEKKNIFVPNNEIQEKFARVLVMADSAHGFGAIANDRKSGNIADFTCFSFHAVKNLTTAEGGAVTWLNRSCLDDEWVYKQFQLLSLHGQTKDALSKNEIGSWEYDVVSPAYKCNMTDIQAGIGLAQLQRYPKLLERRHNIINIYNQTFKDLPVDVLCHKNDKQISSGHLYLVRIQNCDIRQRNEIISEMAKLGIICNVHYKPLPLLTAYKNLGFNISDYPNAYLQFENEITLPLYSSLSNEEVSYIAENFISVVRRYIKR